MKRRRYRRNPRLIPTQDAKIASQAATAPPPIENLIFHFPKSHLFCKLAGVRCTRQRDSGKLPIVVIGKFQYVSRQWIEADT